MSTSATIFATLVAYQLALIAIGLWASRRTHDEGDFFLGGRQLGGWVAALSASASSSSAWTLLGVSGAAYAWGLSAIWLFPATVGGFLLNWFVIAPRLMKASRADGSLTLTQFVAGSGSWSRRIRLLSSFVIVFSFLFYIAAQFQAAGLAFAASFGLSAHISIAIGVAVVVAYTLLGGFWAVSVTDSLQGLLMVSTAVILPIAALIAVGGPGALAESFAEGGGVFGPRAGIVALGFVMGTLGIGLGYPGQPHVVNRFMALRDEASLRGGRAISITWAVLIYAGMLVTGWCGRILLEAGPDGEEILFTVAAAVLPAILAGIMTAAVLSAIMSTADSQLLVASSSIIIDIRRERPADGARGTASSRSVVLAVSVVAMLVAMFAPATIFSRVLFAWHAIGSAFGPILILKLFGRRIEGAVAFASMAIGFGLTVIFYLLPNTPGDWLERLVPLAAAMLVGLAGSGRGNLENSH
ncbi:MAG: sodium/proline symporter [Acidobacteria bacterium]|nr:sodium/proline symporter [Acidobacteriota bacterium]